MYFYILVVAAANLAFLILGPIYKNQYNLQADCNLLAARFISDLLFLYHSLVLQPRQYF